MIEYPSHFVCVSTYYMQLIPLKYYYNGERVKVMKMYDSEKKQVDMIVHLYVINFLTRSRYYHQWILLAPSNNFLMMIMTIHIDVYLFIHVENKQANKL